MPYKKEYHDITCSKCGKVFSVLTPAYLKRLKDPEYGTICQPCRARMQQASMSKEERMRRNKKASESVKKKYANMGEEEKEKRRQTRKTKIQATWKNKSKEELDELSERRSKIQKDRIAKLTDEQRAEIGRKISATKNKINSEMSEEEKAARKKKNQDDRKEYWDSLSEEERETIRNRLKQNARDYWDNISEEDLAARREKYSKIMKERWANLDDSVKDERLQKMSDGYTEWYANLSDEEKAHLSEVKSKNMTERWANMTEEDYYRIMERRALAWEAYVDRVGEDTISEMSSANMQNYWDNLDPETRSERIKFITNIWNTLDEETQNRIRSDQSKYWADMTDEERAQAKKAISNGIKRYYASLSDIERDAIRERSRIRWKNLPPEEQRRLYDSLKAWRENLSDEEWQREVKKQHEWMSHLTADELMSLNLKRNLSAAKHNKFHQCFEDAFNNSELSNTLYFRNEFTVFVGKRSHIWDYGIFDKSNMQLVALIDLDGAFYHGDNHDYDGLYSSLYRDQMRGLAIPSKTKVFIINELSFDKCFEYVCKHINDTYDEYALELSHQIDIAGFPYHNYSDRELIRSYKDLCNARVDDGFYAQYSSDIRIGDRLIYQFHSSIYRANVRDMISPYQAVMDPQIRMNMISNGTMFQSYLQHNKLLQGFDMSNVAPKVSVFSAARAKLIIHNYLNDFDTIFDPFSGFSGRMLGAVSLGKKYIGSDISQIAVNESNNLIEFLHEHGFDIDASVTVVDAHDSYGEYPCLFTCPPYGDTEQWIDVPVSKLTCDAWIDLCLEHFKCQKYVFVVNETSKYADHIVKTVSYYSHLNSSTEYIVVI